MKYLIVVMFLAVTTLPVILSAQEKNSPPKKKAVAAKEAQCTSDSDCTKAQVCTEGVCDFPRADWRKGLEFEARGGMGICVSIEEECENEGGEIKPGFGGGLFTGIRVNPSVAVGVDFGYFMLGDPKEADIDYSHYARFMNLMFEVRAYKPYSFKSGFGDIYLKIGAGYLSYKEMIKDDDASMSIRLYSPLNMKLGLGTTFFFVQNSKSGDIGAGVGIDYLFFFAKRFEECYKFEGQEECGKDQSDELNYPFHNMQFSAHLTWVFPIF